MIFARKLNILEVCFQLQYTLLLCRGHYAAIQLHRVGQFFEFSIFASFKILSMTRIYLTNHEKVFLLEECDI